jgi:hypothetical protein
MATAVIDAAKNAGVRHFVLCSVLHPMRTKLVTHKLKLQCVYPRMPCKYVDQAGCVRVEEYLIESRMNFTILQVRISVNARTTSLTVGGYSPHITCRMFL